MPLTKPHTTIVFTHGGQVKTIARRGTIPIRGKTSVESLLAKHGVNGQIVVWHVAPGQSVVITQHQVA